MYVQVSRLVIVNWLTAFSYNLYFYWLLCQSASSTTLLMLLQVIHVTQ